MFRIMSQKLTQNCTPGFNSKNISWGKQDNFPGITTALPTQTDTLETKR